MPAEKVVLLVGPPQVRLAACQQGQVAHPVWQIRMGFTRPEQPGAGRECRIQEVELARPGSFHVLPDGLSLAWTHVKECQAVLTGRQDVQAAGQRRMAA